MDIQQKFIKFNNPNRALDPMGCVLHCTMNFEDSDDMEFEYFNTGDRQSSAHAFVDADSITQCIPWNKVAWHGGPTANHSMNGVEMCCTNDPVKFKKIWNNTVWLFAYLFVNVYKINTVTVNNLMSHAEVSAKFGETDHTDPVEYFAKFGKQVSDFRADVQSQINKMLLEGVKMNVNEALNILVEKGIINSPDYWRTACSVVKYLDQFIINIATKIKG